MTDLKNPFERAMAILAKAGIYTVKIAGTSPSGVRVVVEGGAPKPGRSRPAKPANHGGGL